MCPTRFWLFLAAVIFLTAGCRLPTAVPPGQEGTLLPTEDIGPYLTQAAEATVFAYPPTRPTCTPEPFEPTPAPTLPGRTPAPTWTPFCIRERPYSTPTPFPTPVRPTPWSTPALTPIPVASPPFIPGLGPARPFQVFFQKGNAIWMVDSEGGPPQLILDTMASYSMTLEWTPDSLSPDGRYLAVVLADPRPLRKGERRSTDIYLYDRTTAGRTLLVAGGGDPRWSPDGRRIAYQKENALWVMDITTGTAWQVFMLDEQAVFNYGAAIYAPTWSPNGEWLAFRHYPKGPYDLAEPLIVKANGSGDIIRLLSQPTWCDSEGSVDWSADSLRVLYVIRPSNWKNVCMGPAQCHELWTMNVDGSGRLQLLPMIFGGISRLPRWSPDGKWIVFSGEFYFERSDTRLSLWLSKADGTALLRLTDPYPTSNDWDPAWSPDGTRVIFQRDGVGILALDLTDGSTYPLYPEAVDFFIVR